MMLLDPVNSRQQSFLGVLCISINFTLKFDKSVIFLPVELVTTFVRMFSSCLLIITSANN